MIEAAITLCYREVAGSDLRRVVGCPDLGLAWFSSLASENYCNSTKFILPLDAIGDDKY